MEFERKAFIRILDTLTSTYQIDNNISSYPRAL